MGCVVYLCATRLACVCRETRRVRVEVGIFSIWRFRLYGLSPNLPVSLVMREVQYIIHFMQLFDI